MKYASILACFFLLIIPHLTFSQSDSIKTGSILNKMEQHFKSFACEDAYLHFDKPYYLAGDTIYFAAYLTMGEHHLPSFISGVLYVDLIDPDGKAVQTIKLQSIAGVCKGDFALPDTLKGGHYRIDAFTHWMSNDKYKGAFSANIFIGSKSTINKAFKSKEQKNPKPDLQFLPESGYLINGLKTKVAFKAINLKGTSIAVKGTVIDDKNNIVASFQSTHLGMGYFQLEPVAGRLYRAEVKFEDGFEDTINLPKSIQSGITVAINNDSVATAKVNILSNELFYSQNKSKKFLLVIYSEGVATSINFSLDSLNTKFEILKRRLHTGVARITLFTDSQIPICERLFFVSNHNEVKVNLDANKSVYNKRDSVFIHFKATDAALNPIEGNFSVSVLDNGKIPVNNDSRVTILTHYLLTAQLQGYVEQPNYYFSDQTPKKANELDLVMLTHGFRRFRWQDVLQIDSTRRLVDAEKGLSISGVAKTLSGKPLNNASVSLLSPQRGIIIAQNTDEWGSFHFENLVFEDSTSFILNATKSNGSNLTKLNYTRGISSTPVIDNSDVLPEPNDENLIDYLKNDDRKSSLITTLRQQSTSHLLKEVLIKDKKNTKSEAKYGFPDRTITQKQIGYGGQLKVKLASLIHRPGYAIHAPLIVVNGIEMPIGFDVNEISSGSVKSIEVFQNERGQDYDGVYYITTTFGLQGEDIFSSGFLPIKLMGFYRSRKLYKPRYCNDELTNDIIDSRTTIYWNADIKTDKNGNAEFNYFNGDGNASYTIYIEGLGKRGQLVSFSYSYNVN